MYCIKLSNLKDKVCGIYLLFFIESNKIYIGQSCNIKRRMYEHNNINKNLRREKTPPVDRAIIKYGKRQEIFILEECKEEELNQKEKEWIKYFNLPDKNKGYNVAEGGKNNLSQNRKLSSNQVLDIRKRKYKGERKKDVYKDYKHILSFDGFEKVWLGTSYPQVGKELLNKFKGKTRQEYSSEANSGENNGMAKLNNQKVREIRSKFKQGITIRDLAEEYNVSRNTISAVVHYRSWKNVE